MQVTNRDRAIAALNHQQTDRVPYSIGFTQKALAKMVEFYGDPGFVARLQNCLISLPTEPKNAWTEVQPDVWQDQFGVQWNRFLDKDIGIVCNRLITPENIGDFSWPDPDDASRYGWADASSATCDGLRVAGIGFSLFERAWTLAGMTEVLMAMVSNPSFVDRLLDGILAFNLRIIENACAGDIDAMYFGDDWGCQRGLIMGADLWRRFIKPRFREMCHAAKHRGKYVFLHSCGKVDELFEDLIECGLDVFNPFQPEVIDVFEAKRGFGNCLCFHGGISTQRTLPYGTEEDVRKEVRRLLREVGKDGGYIAAPAHAIPADAKPENVAAMIEELENQ